MKLSAKEERFLTAWMRDELNYRGGPGPAKLLEREHRAKPADLAMLTAAWIPDPGEQCRRAEAADESGPLEWPWKDEKELYTRLYEAEVGLGLAISTAPESI